MPRALPRTPTRTAIKGPRMAPTECETVKLNLNSQLPPVDADKIFSTILMAGRRFMNNRSLEGGKWSTSCHYQLGAK